MLLLWGSFWCSICGLWSVISLHVGLFMLDYFVEGRGGVKGDKQCNVAIRVDRGPTCCDVGAVPGRSVAMCGDPQAHITNGCGYRQCKSGKNRLICSEDPEQVACVSVHCKLVTRATQLGAYRQRRGGVKGKICSGMTICLSIGVTGCYNQAYQKAGRTSLCDNLRSSDLLNQEG